MRRSLLCLCALALACSGKSSHKLVILHTNDEHSHLLGFGPEADDFPVAASAGSGIKGGVSRRSVVLNAQRDAAKAAGAETLTVSAGDNMMGTLTQIAATSASPDYKIMKMLGYDITTLGNHEFDFGPNALATIIDAAKTGPGAGLPPIVASNIHFSGTDGDAKLAAKFDEAGTDASKDIHRSYLITTPKGLKVGFVGIMGADAYAVAPLAAPTTFSLASGQTPDNRLANMAKIYQDIQPVVNALKRDQKADIVVALSHSGADAANPAKSEDFAIAQNVTGIDLIVSGHTHTEVKATLIENARSHQKVLVQQAGRFGDNVGRITLTVDGDGNVSFDMTNSDLVKVDDTTPASNTDLNTFVGGIVNALETTPVKPNAPSFLAFTLFETAGRPPAPPANLGDLYNYALAKVDFDVDNTGKLVETALLDLIADAQLAAADALKPTDLALEAAGVVRVSKLEKGKKGELDFGDIFRAVPLGASPVTPPTPGYPLCYVGLYLAEVKATFEVTAGFAYAGHEDLYVIPAGFKFEYDTSRPPFNPNGDTTDKNNGRVTKIQMLNRPFPTNGNYDSGTYTTVFDITNTVSPTGFPGWPSLSPLKVIRTAANLYLVTFATFAGVHIKNPATGLPIAGNDPITTIMNRPDPDNTEVKEWEALGAYVKAQAAANGGKLPARYNKDDPSGALRRAICTGPLCAR
jgi:5'-nucleotidase